MNNAYGAQQSQNAVNFNNNIETMFGNIRVENGIENSFDPSQIVTIAEEVLNEKGPLPVGEVGKMLQEATGNPHFSQVLKERHNGLKKFLEKYADKFIMSCDHPFNPHVYLRRSYSPDDQRIIEGGSKIFLDKKPKVRGILSTPILIYASNMLCTFLSFFFFRNLVAKKRKHGLL